MPRYATLGILMLLLAPFSDSPAWSLEPIWAKNAVRAQMSCDPAAPIRIPSPDRALVAEARCGPADSEGDRPVLLTITSRNGRTRTAELPKGTNELLWAPSSKSFLINGGETSYSGFFVRAYDLRNDRVETREFTATAQRDMVAIFPPCRAANRNAEDCKRIEANPQYNMSGLAWTEGGAAVVVLAEIPCSSGYGGIMCQVEGYELEVSTGKILRRMSARELKQEWQDAAAWEIRVPDPPVYGAP